MMRALVIALCVSAASCASLERAHDAALEGFTWPTKGAIAEGVAFDPTTRDFFVSSVRERRIWRVTPEGEFHGFCADPGGAHRPFGMAFDPRRRSLWVAISSPAQVSDTGLRRQGVSGICEVELAPGRGASLVAMIGGEEEHLLGDVTLAPDGTVWATDSSTPGIYRLDPDAARRKLEPVPIGEGWKNPQGLAFDDRGELFVADYPRGVFRVDPVAGTSTLVASSDERLRGVDGLYWHDGALYAIQNGTRTHRVLRVVLDPARESVERVDVLLEGPPLDDPTLGVFAEGAFFVNAVSGWGDYTETGERSARELSEHRVVRIEIGPGR